MKRGPEEGGKTRSRRGSEKVERVRNACTKKIVRQNKSHDDKRGRKGIGESTVRSKNPANQA